MGEIKVYRIPKGKASKSSFDFIKENFYDKEFCVEDLPDVNESKIFWMDPGADKQAKIEILVEMSRVGLLSYRRVSEEFKDEPPIEKVLYNLTREGKQAER